MRLRISPGPVRERLAAAVAEAGAQAERSGDVLHLSYPAAALGHPDPEQEEMELLFFVRAWLAGEHDAVAEVLG